MGCLLAKIYADNKKMNTGIMSENVTEIILERNQDMRGGIAVRPTVFVCEGHHIAEYRLQGIQNLGRPSGTSVPEIPVYSRFVSRNHGIFETEGLTSVFTAINTTNGIMHKGRFLDPWEKIALKDGYEFTIPSGDDNTGSVLLIYADSEERIRFWRRLQEASWDKLTGLCDRDSFITWWKQNHENKDYEEVILFILDVDFFKEINDKNGHNAGDEALKTVADKLRRAVRYENQVCRWGGDEFVGILPVSVDKAEERLVEVSKKIADDSKAAGVPISVSIGYVDMHEVSDILDIPGIVSLADKALYKAKESGRGNIIGYKYWR